MFTERAYACPACKNFFSLYYPSPAGSCLAEADGLFFFFFLVQIGVTPVVFGAKVSRRIGSNDMPFKTQTKIPPCNSVPPHCPSPTLQECFLTVPINFKIECFLSFRVVVVCAETDTWINIKK